MGYYFTVNKNDSTPLYKQLSNELAKKIRAGSFNKGEKLPPERELAEESGLSRGTVKKAYEQLYREGLVNIVQGSGTFVCYGEKDKTCVEKSDAGMAVDRMVSHLTALGYGEEEILSLVNVRLFHRRIDGNTVKVAAVDCNPETLDIFKNQLSYIQGMSYMSFLLGDVMQYASPAEIFSEFDLIFTTTTHFEELKNLIPTCVDKILQAAISPDKETVIEMAGLGHGEELGIITVSKRFAHIIRSNLKAFELTLEDSDFLLVEGLSDQTLKNFLAMKRTVIIPPLFAMDLDKDLGNCLLEFNKGGGRLIAFNYTIERGSLVYMEEKMQPRLAAKEEHFC